MDLKIINIKNDGVFTVEGEDGVQQDVVLYLRQTHPTIPGVSILCLPAQPGEVGEE